MCVCIFRTDSEKKAAVLDEFARQVFILFFNSLLYELLLRQLEKLSCLTCVRQQWPQEQQYAVLPVNVEF